MYIRNSGHIINFIYIFLQVLQVFPDRYIMYCQFCNLNFASFVNRNKFLFSKLCYGFVLVVEFESLPKLCFGGYIGRIKIKVFGNLRLKKLRGILELGMDGLAM